MNFFNTEGKRILYKNQEFNILKTSLGKKWWTISMSNDKNNIFTLRIRIGREDRVKFIGEAEKFDVNLQKHICSKIEKTNQTKEEKRKTKWLDMEPAPGKIAVVRTNGGPMNFTIGRVTELGFYAEEPQMGRYINQRYVSEVLQE